MQSSYIIKFKLNCTRRDSLDAFSNRVTSIPEVDSCYLVTGHFDFIANLESKKMPLDMKIIREKLHRIENLKEMHIYMANRIHLNKNRDIFAKSLLQKHPST